MTSIPMPPVVASEDVPEGCVLLVSGLREYSPGEGDTPNHEVPGTRYEDEDGREKVLGFLDAARAIDCGVGR